MTIGDKAAPPKITELNKLRRELLIVDSKTDWSSIVNESNVEKQIEIRAELLRAIKRINKELNK